MTVPFPKKFATNHDVVTETGDDGLIRVGRKQNGVEGYFLFREVEHFLNSLSSDVVSHVVLTDATDIDIFLSRLSLMSRMRYVQYMKNDISYTDWADSFGLLYCMSKRTPYVELAVEDGVAVVELKGVVTDHGFSEAHQRMTFIRQQPWESELEGLRENETYEGKDYVERMNRYLHEFFVDYTELE